MTPACRGPWSCVGCLWCEARAGEGERRVCDGPARGARGGQGCEWFAPGARRAPPPAPRDRVVWGRDPGRPPPARAQRRGGAVGPHGRCACRRASAWGPGGRGLGAEAGSRGSALGSGAAGRSVGPGSCRFGSMVPRWTIGARVGATVPGILRWEGPGKAAALDGGTVCPSSAGRRGRVPAGSGRGSPAGCLQWRSSAPWGALLSPRS